MFLIKAYFCSVTIFEAVATWINFRNGRRGAGLKYKGMIYEGNGHDKRHRLGLTEITRIM